VTLDWTIAEKRCIRKRGLKNENLTDLLKWVEIEISSFKDNDVKDGTFLRE